MGKTSTRLARILRTADISFIMASRKGESANLPSFFVARFDWLYETNYDNPFQHQSLSGENMTAICVVIPEHEDPVTPTNSYKHGVKRFVYFTGSTAEKGGGPVDEKVWEHLDQIGIEYCVLRPSWLMENFSEMQYINSIKNEGKIYTACGDGNIPFISADDIAAVAYLTDAEVPAETVKVLSPELLTYDEAAAKLSEILGREFVNVKLSEQEAVMQYVGIGFPPPAPGFMTWLERNTATGGEHMTIDVVLRVSGPTA